jgi:hypothetical protein
MPERSAGPLHIKRPDGTETVARPYRPDELRSIRNNPGKSKVRPEAVDAWRTKTGTATERIRSLLWVIFGHATKKPSTDWERRRYTRAARVLAERRATHAQITVKSARLRAELGPKAAIESLIERWSDL